MQMASTEEIQESAVETFKRWILSRPPWVRERYVPLSFQTAARTACTFGNRAVLSMSSW